MRLLAGVLHSDEIVWNSYTWDADAHKQINTKRLSVRFSVDLGTYWDGAEKTFSISFPEDGTYLLYVRVHIVGANKMDAGSSVVLSGNGITATTQNQYRWPRTGIVGIRLFSLFLLRPVHTIIH